MASVQLDHVSKRFGSTHVINGVSLSIEDGEFVVFVGPSGCGKSTLLRLIAGLESITDGDLMIGDQRVNNLTPQERGVGMVFQSYALYPHMSVYDNMAFGLKLEKAGKETVAERINETARILQLEPLLERKPKALSGGQRQRVAMGRAMAREPGILLFDEPLSNLDASLRVQMRNEIARLHGRLGSTMIYVTHDQVEAMTLADKIVVLRAGHIEQVGSPRTLYERPASKFVAGFIGSPAMNFMAATLVDATDTGCRVNVPGLGDIDLPFQARDVARGASLSLGIRPEHLQPGDPEGDNRFDVVNVEYLGNECCIYLDNATDTFLTSRVEAATPITRGDTVSLHLDPQHVHLFDSDERALARTGADRQ
ncbi:ABC transporter ATP-binding protein [Larsenimonas rhizosphaerae]|uniref:ABC transporter ATP-binding protein n=1 Tax=Larsenimonas rhizosphaerae TaxID=2944682 RepID=UPI0020349347|nr:sn-glycerol-3-phosphate ABC transporter ATP-binding protein UgpC [Larsenimonas rhizosphaerae]MCM2131167.1 sn-glycerol-3-phosphate ABC transporter ATP-binding protein UgpC [Larsenimonas rhizosphaerae]